MKARAMGPFIPPPDPEIVTNLLGRRVHVVAGKGGVGRTTVAAALALRFAREGHRTLLVEVDAPDDAANALGVQPAVDVPREVLDGLWLCRLTPWGSLKEYALLVLKFKALYNLVFENRVVKYLLRSIPSLGEFTMVGKTWYHSTEKIDDEPRFHRIVIDAPATGHAITFLGVARTVADVVPAGPMREFSEKMAALVESEDACLHVVTLPEEMPVNEALELLETGQREVRMRPGLGFVNQVLHELFPTREHELIAALAEDRVLGAYGEAARRRIDRETWQAEHAERFAAASGLPTVAIPRAERQATGWPDLDVVDVVLNDACDAKKRAGHG